MSDEQQLAQKHAEDHTQLQGKYNQEVMHNHGIHLEIKNGMSYFSGWDSKANQQKDITSDELSKKLDLVRKELAEKGVSIAKNGTAQEQIAYLTVIASMTETGITESKKAQIENAGAAIKDVLNETVNFLNRAKVKVDDGKSAETTQTGDANDFMKRCSYISDAVWNDIFKRARADQFHVLKTEAPEIIAVARTDVGSAYHKTETHVVEVIATMGTDNVYRKDKVKGAFIDQYSLQEEQELKTKGAEVLRTLAEGDLKVGKAENKTGLYTDAGAVHFKYKNIKGKAEDVMLVSADGKINGKAMLNFNYVYNTQGDKTKDGKQTQEGKIKELNGRTQESNTSLRAKIYEGVTKDNESWNSKIEKRIDNYMESYYPSLAGAAAKKAGGKELSKEEESQLKKYDTLREKLAPKIKAALLLSRMASEQQVQAAPVQEQAKAEPVKVAPVEKTAEPVQKELDAKTEVAERNSVNKLLSSSNKAFEEVKENLKQDKGIDNVVTQSNALSPVMVELDKKIADIMGIQEKYPGKPLEAERVKLEQMSKDIREYLTEKKWEA